MAAFFTNVLISSKITETEAYLGPWQNLVHVSFSCKNSYP